MKEDNPMSNEANERHIADDPSLWWKQAVVYQVYPRSFKDSRGEGLGQIAGVTEKIDYLKDLGVDAIWLSPFYPSQLADGGYDVDDYRNVDPKLGTMDDFDELAKAAHTRDIKVVVDIVPNHSSNLHEWFKAALAAEPGSPERDRYIFRDGKGPNGDQPPTNWENHFGGPAWTRVPDGQWYLHMFTKEQPDWNWNNREVRDDFLRTLRFWLDHGADGFRVDMADSLVKHDDDGKPYTIRTWQYMFSKIRPEFPEVAFVSEWGRPRESLEAGFDMDFYLDWRWDGIPNGYNMLLRNVDDPLSRDGDLSYFNADSKTPIASFLEQYEPQLRDAERLGGTFNFITCNHDTARIAPRLSEREIALAYCTLFAMPGTPFLYYGDEIGMRYLPLPTLEGGYVRTGSRTPMQWSAASLAGLKAGAISHTDDETSAYLPVDPSADAPTVAESRDDSLWRIVHDMLHLRNETEALHARGTFTALSHGRLFAFARSSGSQRVIIAVNPSRHSERLQLPEGDFTEIFHIGDIDVSGNSLNMSLQSFAILRD